MLARRWSNWSSLTLLVGVGNGTTILKKCLAVSSNKHTSPITRNSTPSYDSGTRKKENMCLQKDSMQIFTAALLMIAKAWE